MLLCAYTGNQVRAFGAVRKATLHRESYALQHATDDYHCSLSGPEGDSSLVLSAPHAIRPVVLEDNQATIRIMESGKSPAFRHADKTQRINSTWDGYPSNSDERAMFLLALALPYQTLYQCR